MSSYPVPAKRHDIFISAFEKFVSERQKEINRVDKLHRPYELVRVALESLKLQNDTRLELSTSGIDVIIPLLDDDTLEHERHIVETIGKALLPIHTDGIPAAVPQTGLTIHYYWQLHSLAEKDMSPPDVDLYFEVPSKGTKHIEVTHTEEASTYTYRKYKAEWITHKEVSDDSQGTKSHPNSE